MLTVGPQARSAGLPVDGGEGEEEVEGEGGADGVGDGAGEGEEEGEGLPLQDLDWSASTVQMLVDGAVVWHALEAGTPNVSLMVECSVGYSLCSSIAHVGVQPTVQALATAESAVWPSSPRQSLYALPPDTHVCKADSQVVEH